MVVTGYYSRYYRHRGRGFQAMHSLTAASIRSAGVAEDVTDMRMFEEQTKIIQALAKQAPGVFLGRCATSYWAVSRTVIPSSYMQMTNIVKKKEKNIIKVRH